MPQKAKSSKSPGTKKSARAVERFFKALRSEFGNAMRLGPTLTAFLELNASDDAISVQSEWVADAAPYLREKYGVLVIGRASNGHFGPRIEDLAKAKSADQVPIVYADRQGLEPEVAAATFGDFLSIWAYAPDFFELHSQKASQWDSIHDEFFDGRTKAEVAIVHSVLSLPGVSKLATGAEVVRLLRKVRGIKPLAYRLDDREAFEEATKKSFEAKVGTSKLLIDLETIESEAGQTNLIIGVNAPGAWAERLIKHPAVRKPLRAFLTEMQGRHPDRGIKLKFAKVPRAEGEEMKRSLSVALKHAGATDLIEEFGLDDAADESDDSGQSFEATRERIMQIQARALKDLERIRGRRNSEK